MGEAEDRQAEAHDLSGGSQKDRGGAESKVGEGQARRLMAHPNAESRYSLLELQPEL